MNHGLDTGFLVALEISEHPSHASNKFELSRLIKAGDRLSLVPQVLSEFVHIVTNSRRFQNPLSKVESGDCLLVEKIVRTPKKFRNVKHLASRIAPFAARSIVGNVMRRGFPLPQPGNLNDWGTTKDQLEWLACLVEQCNDNGVENSSHFFA